MEPPEIGMGSFEIRQNNLPYPSAWVFSTGAPYGNTEYWVWVSGPPGSPYILAVSAPSLPPTSHWDFIKINATAANLYAYAQAMAPPGAILSSAQHNKVKWP